MPRRLPRTQHYRPREFILWVERYARSYHVVRGSRPQLESVTRPPTRGQSAPPDEKRRKFPLVISVINSDETVSTTFSRLVGSTGGGTEMEFKQAFFQDYFSGLSD
jgi:hypothetical protein